MAAHSRLNDAEIKEYLDRTKDDLDFMTSRHSRGPNVPPSNKRVLYSILRSCIVANPEAVKEEYGDSRKWVGLVPNYFDNYWRNIGPRQIKPEEIEFRQEVGMAIDYLHSTISIHDGIDDIIAKYFCTQKEIGQAQVASRCTELLPSDAMSEKGVGKSTGRGDLPAFSRGYIAHLPKVKRDLICTALSLYLTTDDDGNFKPAETYERLEILDALAKEEAP